MGIREMILTLPKACDSKLIFPRSNSDIVRTTRARIIYLRNDYKAIMSKIEAGLHDHYAITKEEAAAPSSGTAQRAGARSTGRPGASGAETNLPDTAFAKVNSVVTGSPADDAGMKAGDEVLRFGLVDFMNHEKLSKVAETVQQNQGVSACPSFVHIVTLTRPSSV